MNEPVIEILHHIKSYDKAAIVENNIPYSYLDLDLLSDSISSLLVDNHCQIGDRVLLLINPGIRFTSALFALWKCGAVAVPMFLDSPTDVLSYYIEDSGAIFF